MDQHEEPIECENADNPAHIAAGGEEVDEPPWVRQVRHHISVKVHQYLLVHAGGELQQAAGSRSGDRNRK